MMNLDSSLELLCSMSPKFRGVTSRKKLKKSPHKLCLKTNIRRSSVFDKKQHSNHMLDSSVIILNDSVTSDNSFPKDIKVLKDPVIISSTSESIDTPEPSDIEQASDEIFKLTSKYLDTEKWLSDNEKLDGYSKVFSFKHNSDNESVDDDELDLKVTNDKIELKSDRVSGTWQVVCVETKAGKEPLRTSILKSQFDCSEKKSQNEISENDSISESNKSVENILDELYGKSWRVNRDQVLAKTEPRKTKKRSPLRLPVTERKLQLPKAKAKTAETPAWALRLKDLCDPDTDASDNSSTKSSLRQSLGDISDTCRKLNFSSDSEDETDKPTKKMNIKRINSVKKKPQTIRHSSSSSAGSSSGSDTDSFNLIVRKKSTSKSGKNTKTNVFVQDKKKLNLNNDLKKKDSKILNKNKTDNVNKNNKSDNLSKMVRTATSTSGVQKYSFLKSLSGGISRHQCNDKAYCFKTNYATQREQLARELFKMYNENIFDNAIPSDTPLQWNIRMRGTAGFCYNRRITKTNGTVLRSCRIVLATKILDTADRLRDTLVHEMCHAATWMVNNVSDGHGSHWKNWAHKAIKTYPELPPIKRCHDYQINTKYTYKCMDCGYSIGRHSKSLDIERKRCGYCYGKFEMFINKTTKSGLKQMTPATPKGNPNGFALYVKENYSAVKVKSTNLKHGEVMKILGQQFAALKILQNN